MNNPFEAIDARLSNLEKLIIDLKHETLPKILNENVTNQKIVVDMDGLLKARPHLGSRSTIYKKVSQCLIPHSKEGKKLYFNLSEIDEWLMSNKVKTVTELHFEYDRKRH